MRLGAEPNFFDEMGVFEKFIGNRFFRKYIILLHYYILHYYIKDFDPLEWGCFLKLIIYYNKL